MDLSPIFNQFIDMLWYLIPFSILLVVFKSPWFKGVFGEFLVNLSAKLLLDKDKYHLIKNVTLPTEGGSTQIDHIIVSVFGVFVVETKNMKGWIFGSANQKTWTQKIYRHSSKFQNPLHQNYKHLKTLESSLGISGDFLRSVIVFVGNSTFKTQMPDNVTHSGGYVRYIKSKKTPVLTELQVRKIVNKIKRDRLTPSFKTNREHVRYVKSVVAEKEKKKPPLCPKCGNIMVLRRVKNGGDAGKKFWGCTLFPKCRGALNATPHTLHRQSKSKV